MKYAQYILLLLLLQTTFAEAQQWVSITVKPANAILTVDETRLKLRDGKAELLLPVGQHRYTVESPYYETMTDTFELKETVRRDLNLVMQSAYAYIKVWTGENGAEVYINQKSIGRGSVISNRLIAGNHRLTVLRDTLCLYDGRVTLKEAEKKRINIEALGTEPFRWDEARWLVPLDAMGDETSIDSMLMAEAHASASLDSCCVNVTSVPDGAVIIIDGREYGTTPLVITGLTANRKYLVTLKKDGYKNAHATFSSEAENVAEVQLKMKK